MLLGFRHYASLPCHLTGCTQAVYCPSHGPNLYTVTKVPVRNKLCPLPFPFLPAILSEDAAFYPSLHSSFSFSLVLFSLPIPFISKISHLSSACKAYLSLRVLIQHGICQGPNSCHFTTHATDINQICTLKKI